MDERCKPHAIMIPLPHQGHINPLISLAVKLASNGFTITYINLEFVHHMLCKSSHSQASDEIDLFSEARKSGLDIRCRTVSDGFPLEFDRVLNLIEYWESMLQDFPARIDERVGEIVRSDPFSAHFLVADTLYAWSAAIASKYNLVNVSFWTEPALVFSLAYHSDLLRQNGHFPCKDGIEEEINYIPGIESINTRSLMPYLKESEVETTSYKLVLSAFNEVKKADFILHNTVHELESETLSALSKYQPNYAIGPISFSKSIATYTVRKSLLPESSCSGWLSSKPPGSVLYVSFGSLVQTSKQMMEEIAYGLLLSEVNFIWVVRLGAVDSADANVFPERFKNEIKDRGLIVPWCDQLRVLSDPGVGGFLTHCGWNSVLESMWYGVPMICFPVTYDQPTNRKLVVEDWKVGIDLCYGTSVDRTQVAEKIQHLMSGSLSQDVEQVRARLRSAVETDGSLDQHFHQFIKDLLPKIYDKNCNRVISS